MKARRAFASLACMAVGFMVAVTGIVPSPGAYEWVLIVGGTATMGCGILISFR